MRGPGSNPTGGNILSLDFFHVVKPLMPILPLLPILSICEKPDYHVCLFQRSTLNLSKMRDVLQIRIECHLPIVCLTLFLFFFVN